MSKWQPMVIKLSPRNIDWLYQRYGCSVKAWSNEINEALDGLRESEFDGLRESEKAVYPAKRKEDSTNLGQPVMDQYN